MYSSGNQLHSRFVHTRPHSFGMISSEGARRFIVSFVCYTAVLSMLVPNMNTLSRRGIPVTVAFPAIQFSGPKHRSTIRTGLHRTKSYSQNVGMIRMTETRVNTGIGSLAQPRVIDKQEILRRFLSTGESTHYESTSIPVEDFTTTVASEQVDNQRYVSQRVMEKGSTS